MHETLLDIAIKLKDEGEDQSYMRSSINRAYYAAFLAARDYCASKGCELGYGASHEKVIDSLKRLPESRREGNQLHDIKRLRGYADYEWRREVTSRDVSRVLKTSFQLVESFREKTYLDSDLRT